MANFTNTADTATTEDVVKVLNDLLETSRDGEYTASAFARRRSIRRSSSRSSRAARPIAPRRRENWSSSSVVSAVRPTKAAR